MKRSLSLLLNIIMVITLIAPQPAQASSAKADTYFNASAKNQTVTAKQFDAALQKATGNDSSFISEEFEINDLGEPITVLQAAQMTYNAYIAKEGDIIPKAQKNLYKQVVSNAIISDASKIGKNDRKYVRYTYVWGLMDGASAGNYSKKRKSNYNELLTKEYANTICQRIENKSLRFKTTADGQLIRTTNLPKNHKQYDYVLANVPNKFYEFPYLYQLFTYDSKGPKALDDYAYPVDMKKLDFYVADYARPVAPILEEKGYDWSEMVIKNVKTRLTVDYKTIGDAWVNELKTTYHTYSKIDQRTAFNKVIDEYVTYVKKNKIKITCSQVYTDKSFLYMTSDSYYYRVHGKFKVSSDLKGFKPQPYGQKLVLAMYDQYGLVIHGGFKLGKTYDVIFDVAIGSYEGESVRNKKIGAECVNNYALFHGDKVIKTK